MRRCSAVAVVGGDLDVVDVVRPDIVRDLEVVSGLKRQHSAAGDRELRLIRAAAEAERDGLARLIGVGRRDGQHGRRVFSDVGCRGRREDRVVVIDRRDGHSDVLRRETAVSVVGLDRHVVDVVRAGIGRGLEVRTGLERQHARTRDRELRRVRAADDGEGCRLAGIGIGGRDGQNRRRVLGDISGRARREHRRVDRDVRHGDGDVLSCRAAGIVVGSHLDVIDIVRADIGGDREIGSRLEGQHTAAGDRELRGVGPASDAEGDGLRGLIGVRGSDGSHRRHSRETVRGRSGSEDRAVVVHRRDRDRDALIRDTEVAVVGSNNHVVDVVRTDIGWILEVGGRLERQHPFTRD